MLMLTVSSQAAQPDYVALAMVLVLAAFVAVMTVRKYLSNKKKARTAAAEPVAVQVKEVQTTQATAPGSAGSIKIHNVEPKTAAMIMAIVADQMGKPLNELRFISIKEV